MGLGRDTRGASLVEYIVVLGAVALLAIGVVRIFGQSVSHAIEAQSGQVSNVNDGPSRNASAGSIAAAGAGGAARGGGGGGGNGGGGGGGRGGGASATAAIEPAHDVKSYGVVFAALAILVVFVVIKIRRTAGAAP